MAESNVSLMSDDSGISVSAMRELMEEVGESPEVEDETPKEPEQENPREGGESEVDDSVEDEEQVDLEDEKEEEGESAEDDGEDSVDDELEPEKFLVARDGEKEIKVPKDAQFEVKINGKTEIMTAQEVINEASGGVHVAREASRLGRERKELEAEKQKNQEYIASIEETVSELHELATSGDAFEFVERIAMLKGTDFAQEMQGMAENAIKYFNQFREMDDSKKALFLENRKLTIAQKRAERKALKEQESLQREQSNAAIARELEAASITFEEAEAAALELKEALENGDYELPPGQDPDVYTIIDFIEQKRLDTKVSEGIDLVDASLKRDEAFVDSLTATVAFNERRNGSPMTAEGVAKLIKATQNISEKKLSESLSKKAKRHAKSGAISKSASSQKPKEDSEPMSSDPLEDHYSKLYG